ncbi:MAG: aminopeptidase P family protein [Candidatus Zixiibacteriota bacterium]|nr:MAG: aminopeptidase P family protein [candidate division Zixibacteria bacterium]
MDLVKAKIEQAVEILDELDIDLWLIFCRETDMMADPALDLVVGGKVVWQSAFFISRSGETLALVGNFDAPDFERAGRYAKVQPYVEDCGRELRKTVEKFNPKKLALDFSKSDVASDGLPYGMYLLLMDYLKGSPYAERVISSEEIISRLRGRKIPEEIRLISSAAFMAADCWKQSIGEIKTGMTEIQIAQIIDSNIRKLGGVNSFDTIVNAGAKTSPGHGHPTEAALAPGDLLHIDFGARVEGFCSDIQRLAYVRKENEASPPEVLINAFNKVREVIDETSKLYRPGTKGYTIDAAARKILKNDGYEEYQHALGHQIGRSVHDGAAIVGPRWKRYGRTPEIPLEEGNTFTIELGIELAGIGYVGLEEDLAVTENGGKFLCPRQTELVII